MSLPCNEGADKETMAWPATTFSRAIPALLLMVDCHVLPRGVDGVHRFQRPQPVANFFS